MVLLAAAAYLRARPVLAPTTPAIIITTITHPKHRATLPRMVEVDIGSATINGLCVGDTWSCVGSQLAREGVKQFSLEAAWELAGGDDWGTWVSNLGAVCSLASFSMSDIFLLRLFAMVGQVCGIVYVQTREPPLWNPTVWQAIFLVINLYQTSKLLLESYGEVRLSAEQQDVYEKLFLQHGLTPRQFSKLCGSARWSDVGRDHVLVEEGEQPGTRSLTLVQSGGLVVRSGGKVVSVRPSPEQPEILHTGFIGDVAFLEALEREETGNEQLRFASRGWAEGVHVATSAPCRLLSWPADELRAVLLDDDALKARFVQVLASNVVSKLEAADLTRDLAIPTLRDRQLVDTTGDGLADAALVDTSGDGLPDTIVPLEQLDSDDFFDEMCEAEPGCDPYTEGALSRAAVEELLRERKTDEAAVAKLFADLDAEGVRFPLSRTEWKRGFSRFVQYIKTRSVQVEGCEGFGAGADVVRLDEGCFVTP